MQLIMCIMCSHLHLQSILCLFFEKSKIHHSINNGVNYTQYKYKIILKILMFHFQESVIFFKRIFQKVMTLPTQETKREFNIKIEHRHDESVRDLDRISHPKRLKDSSSLKQAISANKKASVSQPNAFSAAKSNKKDQQNHLSRIISSFKVNNLSKNFLNKLRLNSVYRTPQTMEQFELDRNKNNFIEKILSTLENTNGINLGSTALTIWSLINIIQITIMVFIFSIMMAFEETSQDPVFLYFRMGSVSLYVIDMILNFTTNKFQSGKELTNLREIGEFYLQEGFFIDFSSILIFPVDLIIDTNIAYLTSFMAIIKLWNNIKKFEKYQYIYIGSSEREQYYGLVKVILTNFVIGHILSILLNLMAGLSHENWYMKINITAKDPWFVKYIWGYYWGTNIMLTVGFGDLAANNYYQAIILIFIQTFSCITLAYNISYVGALIGSIRENDIQKKKKLKYFHRMCKESQIPSEIEKKITNYIEDEYSIKETFSYDQYDAVLDSLPSKLQVEYRKEANKILFDGLGFLSNLSRKTLLSMAEFIQRKICHPDETILKKGAKSEFMILQNGTLCLACRINKSDSPLDGKVIETLQVKENQKAKLLSLDFIKNKAVDYDIKSKKYSILYHLSAENLKDALKSFEIDYQLFCMLRDRNQHIVDEQNIYECSICKNKYHSKFECQKLHYRPLKQMIIYRYLNKVKTGRAQRKKFKRMISDYKALLYRSELQEHYKAFIEQFFGEEDRKQIQIIKKKHNQQRNSFQTNKVNKARVRKGTKLQTIDLSATKLEKLQKLEEGLMEEEKPEEEKKFAKPENKSNSNTFHKIQQLIKSNSISENNSFWDLQCDQAANYRYYFENNNPKKFNLDPLNKKGKKKSIFEIKI